MTLATTGPRPLDSLRLHPDAERVPMADRTDLDRLRASLRENGQQDPIDVSGDVILDGRTRWKLLRELGTLTVQVRQVEMPENHQTAYIVDRALARRHLTADQKRALNDLLRKTVVAVEANPKTGEEMRIGLSRPERAAKLGVTKATVQNWDREEATNSGPIPSTAPTHIRRAGGNTGVYPVAPAPRTPTRSARIAPATKRNGPPWGRHFTLWCRSVLPEDHKHLMQMSDELHKALGRLDLTCGKQEEVA